MRARKHFQNSVVLIRRAVAFNSRLSLSKLKRSMGHLTTCFHSLVICLTSINTYWQPTVCWQFLGMGYK